MAVRERAVARAVRDFFELDAAGGILLVAAAALAMLVDNSPLAWLYDRLVELPVAVSVGRLEIAKPLLLWINDGLMAIFFFVVGLELKREVVEGGLSDLREVTLPALGAVGGMVFPAAIYVALNYDDPMALQGWAVPAATDIAFALGVLALLGDRVPTALKVFLVSIAIFDDVGAIVIIALFYTSNLSPAALITAAACLPILFYLNRRGVLEKSPYLLIGIVIWVATLKSGVHATLAGVVLALFIPIRDANKEASPLHELEHDLHGAVMFGILPLFAFVNAGVDFSEFSIDFALHPVAVGVAAGLFLGKQLGVLGLCWLGVKVGIARLPAGIGWAEIYGVALLCGIGFTMSLFIGSLAFEATGTNQLFDERVGIIAGSILSGIGGYLVLDRALPAK